MTKYTQYTVIESWSLEVLEATVEKAIKGGWQPLGGVSCGKHNDSMDSYGTPFFCQAMVA